MLCLTCFAKFDDDSNAKFILKPKNLIDSLKKTDQIGETIEYKESHVHLNYHKKCAGSDKVCSAL